MFDSARGGTKDDARRYRGLVRTSLTAPPDIRFEAGFLRAALLLGLVREHEVIAWADALLAFIATDAGATALALPDRIRVLAELRQAGILPAPITSVLKSFEDRWMLGSAGVLVDRSLASELDEWLAAAREPAYHRVSIENAEERGAFLGALSRPLVRRRRAPVPHEHGCCAWIDNTPCAWGPMLLLNEALWRVAVAGFSPLPLGSRVPFARISEHAVLVLDETTEEAMDARAADERLAVVSHPGGG